jgi:K+-transporting ATPase KdpF subunit
MQSGAESFDFEALFNFMETLIVSVIALVLFIYLLVAMVYPERF